MKFRNDIDTDIFKKFIEVQGKRILDFKHKNSVLTQKFDLANIQLNETKENIEILSKELTDKSIKISEQNSSVELLLNKTREFENNSNTLKNELNQVEKKLSSIDEIANIRKVEIEKLKDYNTNQGETIEILKNDKQKNKLIIEELAKEIILLKREKTHLINKKNELKKIKDGKNIEIENLNSSFQEVNKDLNICKNINLDLEKEIIRLGKLNWFDKVIGKR